MSRIVLICGNFPTYDRFGCETGTEFVASHGIDEDGMNVVISPDHPTNLGAIFDYKLGEWVIYN